MPTDPIGSSTNVSVGYPDTAKGWADLSAASTGQRKADIDYIRSNNPQITPEAVSLVTDAEVHTLANAMRNQHPGLLGNIGAAIQGNIDGVKGTASAVAGVATSIPDFLKLITSGNFWDRVLFILGGLFLVIIGLVLLLHKSVPIPPVIPV